MEKQGWKILSIVLIVLTVFFILENILIIYVINSVSIDEKRDFECGKLCDNKEDCVMGYYDPDLLSCEYITKNELQGIIDYGGY